jgi:hypothetical protein
MSTLTYFNPQPNQNFSFNPTLDGSPYTAICTFNIYSQRYYISIYNNFRNLIMNRPLIGSPDDFNINLLFGYFNTSTMIYRVSSGNIEVAP